MDVFRFANPEYLYALFVVPVLLLLFVLTLLMRKRAMQKFGNIAPLKRLMPEYSVGRPWFKFIFLILALSALIFVLARPQFGAKLEEVKRKGVEMMICLDISNSMLAEDIKPSRLEKSKRAISQLLDRLNDDKIGLIVFAGDAYVQLPITTDYSAAKMFLNTVSPDIVNKQGTAIGSAIDLAVKSFGPVDEQTKNRVIVVITDGENHEDDAIIAAEEAQKKGIIVHTIGMGLPAGAPIPVPGKYGAGNYRKNREGDVVITKLNEGMMQEIASAGTGIYVRANNTKSALNTIFDEIEKMDKKEIEAKVYSDYDDKFPFAAWLALIFLVIEFIILNRKNRLLKNVKIFDAEN